MNRTRVGLWGVLCLAVAAALGLVASAAEPGDELIQMIVGLVNDKDPDMRTLGLQQVREEAKGPAATKRFAALLPKLSSEGQAGLLDALAARGDKTARPAVLEILKSHESPVRAAALRALGPLGETADVAVLTQALAGAAGPEKTAARASLVALRGEGANAEIVVQLKRATPAVRAELLAVLASRGASEGLPAVWEAAEDPDVRVRAAALGALRVLADPGQTARIVGLLKAAKDSQEQWKAEQALQAVCARGRQSCAEAIAAGLADADPAATAALLRALAKSGGGKALEAIVAATKDPRAEVRGEAVRLLANWPEAAAVPHLLAIARKPESLAQGAVAVQGLVRLASPLRDRPADMALLAEAMKLARRPEEKRAVLGVLGGIPTAESLAMIVPAMDDPALTEEACLTAVLVAEKPGATVPQRRAALAKAAAKAKDPQIRERAKKAMETLGE